MNFAKDNQISCLGPDLIIMAALKHLIQAACDHSEQQTLLEILQFLNILIFYCLAIFILYSNQAVILYKLLYFSWLLV